MTINSITNTSNYTTSSQIQFRRRNKNTNAINLSENALENISAKIEEEKKKKRSKRAIAVGSSVLGASVLIAFLNPKFSTKLINKLKVLQVHADIKLKENKNNFLQSKFYKVLNSLTTGGIKTVSFTNNFNSIKDTYFKKLCTELKILKKPHEAITRWGDSLAKLTVKHSYKKANAKLDNLEVILKKYIDKLPNSEKSKLENKLQTITQERQFFKEENLSKRFEEQENIMSSLNENIRLKLTNYIHGYKNKYVKNSDNFKKNFSFWAQDLVENKRATINKKGLAEVDNLMGNKNGIKGQYNEIIETLSQSLKPEDIEYLKKILKKSEKSLRNANKNECCKYFDKKRDLMLGSAPTDIVSAILGLTVGGVSIATANNKDDRISRLLTGVLPTVGGIVTSIAMTAMLFSGVVGAVIGITTGGILSLTGSTLNRARLKAKTHLTEEEIKELNDA